MDDTVDESVENLLNQVELIKNMDGASHRYKRESLEKLEKLYKCSRKTSLTRKAVIEIESAIEKLKASNRQRKFRSEESCTEFYDLTETTSRKSAKGMRRHETSDRSYRRQSKRESSPKSHRRLQSVVSSVHSWTEVHEVKKEREYTRCSPRSDTISEDEDRYYRRRRTDERRSRRSSPGKYHRSRSPSPSRRDMEREHYRRRDERRDSVERYRRSRSRDEYTERSRRRRRRDGSHDRCSGFNERVVKTEQLDEPCEEHDENERYNCTEPEPPPESPIGASVVEELKNKIRSTLHVSSNRIENQAPAAVVDLTSHQNQHEWQDEFDLDIESPVQPSSSAQIDLPEIQQANVTDKLLVLENDSDNLAQDVQRKKIKFTFTKSLKTDSQVSTVFSEPTNDNLTDARSKLTRMLKSALNERNDDDKPAETPPAVRNQSPIDDDFIDHEIIQKIVSQTQVRTSSSYELSVDVSEGFDSAAAVRMLENKLSEDAQRYDSRTTLINGGATPLARNNQRSPTQFQPFAGTPIVSTTTTTQAVHSNYSSFLATRLPIPSTKFLPIDSKVALPRQLVNPYQHNPFDATISSNDQISHYCQSTRRVETTSIPSTYGEHKNRLAARESTANFIIPKRNNRPTMPESNTSDWHCPDTMTEERNGTEELNITDRDYKRWENNNRPMSQQSKEHTHSQSAKNSTENNTRAPDPVSLKREYGSEARELWRSYKIPKKTTKVKCSTTPVPSTSVAAPKKCVKNDYTSRNSSAIPTSYPSNTPAMDSSAQVKMNATEIDDDDQMRPLSVSPVPSIVELSSSGSEESTENDRKEWERPMNEETNTQPDTNTTTVNDAASDLIPIGSKDEKAVESLMGWMRTNEFATLVDLMTLLSQQTNLDKLKDALTNQNAVDNGEGSSTVMLATTTYAESNGNASNPSHSNQAFKNIDPAWHSLRKILQCQECDKPHGNSLVSHYVNMHPNIEVLTSRLAPEAMENLRSGVHESKSWKTEAHTTYVYKQFCYFCNIYRCMNKLFWIHHMARHTGYYTLKCNHCERKFACKAPNSKCNSIKDFETIPQPQFKKKRLLAYICKLCNFVRFHQNEIENHLCTEHGAAKDSREFEEVTFLSFPDAEGKYVRKNYKKRNPKEVVVEENLANSNDSDDETDSKDAVDSEDEEMDTVTDDDSESEGEYTDWSNMDVHDDEVLSETSSDSDFV